MLGPDGPEGPAEPAPDPTAPNPAAPNPPAACDAAAPANPPAPNPTALGGAAAPANPAAAVRPPNPAVVAVVGELDELAPGSTLSTGPKASKEPAAQLGMTDSDSGELAGFVSHDGVAGTSVPVGLADGVAFANATVGGATESAGDHDPDGLVGPAEPADPGKSAGGHADPAEPANPSCSSVGHTEPDELAGLGVFDDAPDDQGDVSRSSDRHADPDGLAGRDNP